MPKTIVLQHPGPPDICIFPSLSPMCMSTPASARDGVEASVKPLESCFKALKVVIASSHGSTNCKGICFDIATAAQLLYQ